MPSVLRRYASSKGPFERPSSRSDAAGRAPVVLLVSGGADSTALLFLAAHSSLDIDDGRGISHIARERLHVLHINHCLRGLDAEEDQEFVQELSARYGIPCTVRRVDVAAEAQRTHDNVENIGRKVRYEAANELANKLSDELGVPHAAARIVTAHTADDRAETFLMNAIRGSGTAGLASIPRRRNRIVRPLLNRTHEDLCELLRMHGIVWREDQTNYDTSYLRAYVRHTVMPVVLERNNHAIESIASACEILSDEDAYLAGVSARALRELTRRRSEGLIALDAAKLAAIEVALARRIVRSAVLELCPDCRLEARHIGRILHIVAKGEGSTSVAMGLDCRVDHGLLFIRTRSEQRLQAAWLEVPGELKLSATTTLRARLLELPAGSDAAALARSHAREWEQRSVLLDAQVLDLVGGGRLLVDAPQPGDIMCPLGMHGQSKRVSDMLNEAGIPVVERAQVAVVRRGARGELVWLAQIRPDERFACTSGTKVLLELSIDQLDHNEVKGDLPHA